LSQFFAMVDPRDARLSAGWGVALRQIGSQLSQIVESG